MQRRVRVLPSRVVVYLLLAGCLFEELGYAQVWRRVAAGLGGLPAAVPTASGPPRELFFLLRGPAPGGARWRGLLAVAIDGTIMTVADSAAARTAPPATRCCGWRRWSAAGPAPSSTPCSARCPKGDHLRPGPARQSARGHDPAGGPELRRRVPGRADRGDQGRLPDPGPQRELLPAGSRDRSSSASSRAIERPAAQRQICRLARSGISGHQHDPRPTCRRLQCRPFHLAQFSVPADIWQGRRRRITARGMGGLHGYARHGSRRSGQLGRLREDAAFQRAQGRPRVDAEIFGQVGPSPGAVPRARRLGARTGTALARAAATPPRATDARRSAG